MTKKKKPAPAPELYESRKAILQLVERVYEESKYLRFRASELPLNLVYPEIVSTTRKLNDVAAVINEVANAFNKKDY